MRKYNIINNSLGWFCFVIAAITYLLTIEPTASFWDCPEFITQGYKLEVGHPPGNPIFMLTARFFVTVFGGGAEVAAVAVNSMSALLSAATILLLFWTITHLVKKLMVKDGSESVSLVKTVVIMVSGLCGALAYTWSDTFWFSAVEGEVYAFSSFCTALVFWLILKWENRADNPHSDRYLILIAYIIGISIAVHLLNLLCIPAIVLVFYYRKFKNTNVVGSLIALAVSAVIVALILFGLVPGFVAVAQRFEVFFVNTLGTSYNMGVLVYAIITVCVFIWTIWQIRLQKSAGLIKLGVFLSVVLSGMPFIGHGWFVPTLLILALIVYLAGFCKPVPIRVFNVIVLSIFVIFIGYSSYALLLIRSTANTPMNQNAPDNVFALGSYLNREQYGDTPILFGPRMSETVSYLQARDEADNIVEYLEVDENGYPLIHSEVVGPRTYTKEGMIIDDGYDTYTKAVKASADEPDRYVKAAHNPEYRIPDGMSMFFPRMYSDNPTHVSGYKSWSLYSPDFTVNAPAEIMRQWADRGYVTRPEVEMYMNTSKATLVTEPVAVGSQLYDTGVMAWQPSFWDNLKYFFNYQLNHMYWRYFMWNFAGRQNDIAGNGEPHMGNWISGIPAIDNARLGDQSLLPEDYTTGNAGHNVFYFLPLLMGLFGLLWQSLMRHPGGEKRGIEQFWVIFFLFFMTGIAIVLYLNQPPGQPRERDYAFAGSFYAYAIWIGMGVAAIYNALRRMVAAKKKGENTAANDWIFAGIATAVGIFVPLQMVSQTWDDHDRSGRYTARDFGMNYLNSLDDNAVIFVNGDNDTFPLWYAQEVEGCRTDVKVVNLSYLSQDWYARQVASNTYDAQGVPFYMPETAMNYGNTPYYPVSPGMKGNDFGLSGNVTAKDMLTNMYKTGKLKASEAFGYPAHGAESAYYMIGGPNISQVYVPISAETMTETFGAYPVRSNQGNDSTAVTEYRWDITPYTYLRGGSPSQFANLLTYDIIARSASEGFKRPVYFATTVGNNYYLGFEKNMFTSGMAMQVTPFNKDDGDASPVAAKAYINIVDKFRWGGLDGKKHIYLDETVRRMVSSTRLAILQVINDLLETPDDKAPANVREVSANHGLPVPSTYAQMARNLLVLMDTKLPTTMSPYENAQEYEIGKAYIRIGSLLRNKELIVKGRSVLEAYVEKIAKLLEFGQTLGKGLYTNLMRNENRNLYYVLTALSMINYADVELASFNGKVAPSEITDDTYYMLCDLNGLKYQMLMLLEQPSRDLLNQYGVAYLNDAYDLFDKAGVNPYTGVNNFVKRTGIKVDDWINLIY